MKRLFLIIFSIFFIFIFSFISFVSAQTPSSVSHFAACDLCGYCPPNAPPSNWQKCKDCLYPNAGDATTGDTLKISGKTSDPVDTAPTPALGRMYTQLGCIGTNLGGFQKEGAAANVVQTLLNVIFSIVGGLAFLSLIYGSFIVLTSQANPERLNYGKRMIYGAIVGVIFSLSAVFLVNLLASGILKIPGFNNISPTPTPLP